MGFIHKNKGRQSKKKISEDKENHKYTYEAVLDLKTGGNFGYTFRVMPKHDMLVDSETLNLVSWTQK